MKTEKKLSKSGTIRDNILLGRKYNQQRYQDVIEAACLTADFSLLEFGDGTIIGDRGVTLSGGQRKG